MVTEVHVPLGQKAYTIYIGFDLSAYQQQLNSWVVGEKVCLVSNDIVAPYYLSEAKLLFKDYEVDTFILPDGENNKTWESVNKLLTFMLENNYHRQSTMVALGGGVIGDTVGFAASIYQRGIDFIQIPTTLLAQVDSSVGGKTAVNHPLGKNMIGAFHQPRGVWMELQYLETLPEREWRAGLAEVIKIALVADGSFFAWLEDNHAGILAREPILIERMIARSIELKADIVVQDTFDRGVRAYVNLGHTFGHAIEHVLGYGVWLHGEAVGLGLRMACDASQYLKAFPASLSKRVHELLDNWQLPKCLPKATAPHDLLQAMRLDKKNDDRGLRFVLLKDMEDPCVETVDNEAYLIELIASYQS